MGWIRYGACHQIDELLLPFANPTRAFALLNSRCFSTMPLPLSLISTATRSADLETRIAADELPEWRCTFVRLSCTTGDITSSKSRGSLEVASGHVQFDFDSASFRRTSTYH